jgi:hypothetical protein
MCGLCTPVCIADIAPNLVALYVSRAQGAHFVDKPVQLDQRIKEIEAGKFSDEWGRVMKMNDAELTKVCAELK